MENLSLEEMKQIEGGNAACHWGSTIIISGAFAAAAVGSGGLGAFYAAAMSHILIYAVSYACAAAIKQF